MVGQLKIVEVKEIKKDNGIKERAERYGVESLLDSEALSVLTGGTEKVFENFNSFKDLREQIHLLDLTNLQRLKLQTFFTLATRYSKEGRNVIASITCPEDVRDLLRDEMWYLEKEEFRILILNTKNQVVRIETISVGSLNSSIVHPREVFKSALLNSANSIILVHNHPSGNPEPSKEDIVITKRLIEAGDIMGIKVLDHIILGDNRYISLKEKDII